MIRLIRARRWALSSALMLVALVATMPVRANDPPALEDLLEITVSSAARRSQSPAEAPSMVSVITAAEIRNFGWHKLGEALSSLNGVHSSYDRGYTYGGQGVWPPRRFHQPGVADGRRTPAQ